MKLRFNVVLGACGLVCGILLTGCKENVKNASEEFNTLPPAVQKTVRAQAPQAEIADVSRTTVDGREVYEIKLRAEGKNPKVLVAPNGDLVSTEMPNAAGKIERLLTPTGAGTPLSALPLGVQKTVKAHAPNAAIARVLRSENNGRVSYKIEFTDSAYAPIEVTEDGTLLHQNAQ